MKEAVQNVVLAAPRRGYKRRELDRVWGKFLIQWWTAEEVRRGELRSWFRKMSSHAGKAVRRENQALLVPRATQEGHIKECRFKHHCWYKDFACPFAHPGQHPSSQHKDLELAKHRNETVHIVGDAVVMDEDETRELIPKAQARNWYARGDGTCLFYAILHDNAPEGGRLLREQLAAFVQEYWSDI